MSKGKHMTNQPCHKNVGTTLERTLGAEGGDKLVHDMFSPSKQS